MTAIMSPSQFAQNEIEKKCMVEIEAALKKYRCSLIATTVYQDGVLATSIISVKAAEIIITEGGK